MIYIGTRNINNIPVELYQTGASKLMLNIRGIKITLTNGADNAACDAAWAYAARKLGK